MANLPAIDLWREETIHEEKSTKKEEKYLNAVEASQATSLGGLGVKTFVFRDCRLLA
ncbi:hypothetical protein [Ensifer aridi]|uniref:hypothetical protein n=1 Tax=Ensifer aridi TaxID=1708715 RepID=UPI0015579550|nr:hypothetical protein [Ensifer aridi]